MNVMVAASRGGHELGGAEAEHRRVSRSVQQRASWGGSELWGAVEGRGSLLELPGAGS